MKKCFPFLYLWWGHWPSSCHCPVEPCHFSRSLCLSWRTSSHCSWWISALVSWVGPFCAGGSGTSQPGLCQQHRAHRAPQPQGMLWVKLFNILRKKVTESQQLGQRRIIMAFIWVEGIYLELFLERKKLHGLMRFFWIKQCRRANCGQQAMFKIIWVIKHISHASLLKFWSQSFRDLFWGR